LSSGAIRIWHMTGNVQWDSVTVSTVPDLDWEIAGLADMNGDGMLDFIWRHASIGKIAAWFMQDAVFQIAVLMSPSALTDTNWRIVGVADMNMDEQPDLVWQNVDGGLGVWFMNGLSRIYGIRPIPPGVSDPNWHIVGVK
jgi:VCBS repeat protein